MRLIDADALKTEVNFSVTITGKDNAVEVKRLMELYNKAINNAPTIDAEPSEYIDCDCTDFYEMDDNDYCCFGERREDDK